MNGSVTIGLTCAAVFLTAGIVLGIARIHIAKQYVAILTGLKKWFPAVSQLPGMSLEVSVCTTLLAVLSIAWIIIGAVILAATPIIALHK